MNTQRLIWFDGDFTATHYAYCGRYTFVVERVSAEAWKAEQSSVDGTRRVGDGTFKTRRAAMRACEEREAQLSAALETSKQLAAAMGNMDDIEELRQQIKTLKDENDDLAERLQNATDHLRAIERDVRALYEKVETNF